MSLVSGLVAQYDREFKANLGEDEVTLWNLRGES